MRLCTLFVCLTLPLFTGCALVTSTTDAVTNTASATTNAVTKSTEATTNASVTEPEGASYARTEAYVASQLPLIRRDAAAGGGESTDALAALLGESDPAAFGRWMQANYQALFTELNAPEELLSRIAARRS